MPSNPDSQAAKPNDHLLHPDNLELARQLRAQGDLTLPQETTQPYEWSPEQIERRIDAKLRSWLRAGDMEELASLLREERTAILHPFVFRQLEYLQKLLCGWDEDEVAAMEEMGEIIDRDDLDGPVFPAGTCAAAKKTLLHLLSQWINSWFAVIKPYTIEEPKWPRKKGRRHTLPNDELLPFLQFYNDCHRQLDRHDKTFFKPRPGEKPKAFLTRIAGALEQLDLRSYNVDPPTPSAATTIARKSKGERGIRLDSLIYNLLADSSDWSPGEIRGFIQRAEQAYPKEQVRHPPAETR